MSDRMSEYMSNKMPHGRPNRMPVGMSEYMPDDMSAGEDHSKKVIFPCDIAADDFFIRDLTNSTMIDFKDHADIACEIHDS